jgi:hypothetical protein
MHIKITIKNDIFFIVIYSFFYCKESLCSKHKLIKTNKADLDTKITKPALL